jgi:hypothetical protein
LPQDFQISLKAFVPAEVQGGYFPGRVIDKAVKRAPRSRAEPVVAGSAGLEEFSPAASAFPPFEAPAAATGAFRLDSRVFKECRERSAACLNVFPLHVRFPEAGEAGTGITAGFFEGDDPRPQSVFPAAGRMPA